VGHKPPYFEFKANRLARSPSPSAVNFLVYFDPWGNNVPYVYLSSYGQENSYRPGVVGTTPPTAPNPSAPATWPDSPPVTAGLNIGVWIMPYTDASGSRYINPNGFQILSAGKDGLFGPGGAWNSQGGTVTPYTGTVDPSNGTAYRDDQVNFSGGVLSVPGS